ncbi:MAG TPA: hypothetical protein VD866_17260 [Urbifossiella sp.]|nr:hypothetical protein [Urbifossiella sp.]
MKPFTLLLSVGSGLMLLLVLLAGDSSQPLPEERPFPDPDPYETVVIVAVDLSGSYLPLLADRGKAWEFLQRVLDRYARGRGREKLVIAQLSGNNRPMILDTTPDRLRRDFDTPEAFKAFLHAKADPKASRLYDGMTESIDYALGIPGVTPQTNVVVLFLTDYEDNHSSPGGEARLMRAIGTLGKRPGSAVGFYYVGQHLAARLRDDVRATGVKNFVVHSAIETEIPLPNLD